MCLVEVKFEQGSPCGLKERCQWKRVNLNPPAKKLEHNPLMRFPLSDAAERSAFDKKIG